MTDTEVSLASALEATYDSMQGGASAADQTQELPREEDSAAQRLRDEKGRFQARDAAQPDEQNTAAKPADENTDQGSTPDEGAAAATQPLTPPERWSAEDKARFTALPREAQEIVLKRESDVERHLSQKSQELSEKGRQHEALNQILEPRRQAWAQQGINEADEIRGLLDLSDYAAQDPAGFIKWYAGQRGLDLKQIAGVAAAPAAPAQQAGQQQAAVSPEIAPIVSEVNNLKQIIERQQKAELDRQIQSFRESPGHEHFEEVRNEMAALLKAGAAKDMPDAYRKAIWANESVRGKLLEAERKAAEAKRADQARQDAAKAQKAAGTQLSTKASLNGSTPPPADWKEGLDVAYDRIHGAA